MTCLNTNITIKPYTQKPSLLTKYHPFWSLSSCTYIKIEDTVWNFSRFSHSGITRDLGGTLWFCWVSRCLEKVYFDDHF